MKIGRYEIDMEKLDEGDKKILEYLHKELLKDKQLIKELKSDHRKLQYCIKMFTVGIRARQREDKHTLANTT